MREQTPGSHIEMEERLVQFYRPRPPAVDFTDRVEQRLLERAKKMKNRERNSPARWLDSRSFKVAVSIALVLTVLFTAYAVSPPLRAWAQEIVGRIGSLIITDAPIHAERRLPALQTGTLIRTPQETLVPLSQKEASQQAGFGILVPRDLPEWKKGFIIFSDGVVSVMGIYDNWYSVRIIQREQKKDLEVEFPVGDADVFGISIRGYKGYWVEEAATSLIKGGSGYQSMEDLDWHLGEDNLLFWEEDDILYMIFGDSELTRQEMLEIAESLAP